ncbi:MAG: tetratricopeptide repeat protein [Romboutsia sp.]|nr:tetratricopeptide repeat protein [Romboutsia sp.]
MEKKSLDISLIEEEISDLTFFNIDEEESDGTLKALKQSYVTTNYKEETILNLQNTLNHSLEDTSKELKIESYKNYNEALNLANKNYFTTSTELIEKALELNPKDIDILNLRGLLKLLKCDFSKSFESFYTAMCYGNNELSRKYVDILSSDEFKVFLGRYNHSIRFINEDLNQESIHILNNIIEEDPDLIEPYVILALLYDKIGNLKKKQYYLERLEKVDKDNPLFLNKKIDKEKEIEQVSNKKKINFIPYIILGTIVVAGMVYHINNKNKIEKLNEQLNKKNEKIEDIDTQLNETSEKLQETNQKLEETSKSLNETKNQEPEIIVANEEDLYKKAMNLKSNKDYDNAIKYFKNIVKDGKSKKYISESIYQLSLLSEKTKNYDQAVKYYKKYINTYDKEDQYYDDAFYKLGMLYYENGDLDNAKKTFYGMRSEVPDSMYNNSKVKEILAK